MARPLGGLVFGHLGDRVGRKRALVTTMYIMGITTFLMGAVPTFAAIGYWAPALLVLLRIMQGIAIGGEWGGAVLVSVEFAPEGRKGLFGSFPQMGLAFGLLLGTGAFTVLSIVMSDAHFLAWGWRIAFFLSIFLVVVGVFLRSRISETPEFQAAQEEAAEVEQVLPVAELVKHKATLKNLILGIGTRYAEGVAYNIWAVFIIAYATSSAGFSKIQILSAIMIAALFLAVFIPIWGAWSDRVDRRLVFGLGAGAFMILIWPAFMVIHTGSWWGLTAVLVVMLGICYPLMYGPQASFYAELFPPRTRYSGISIVYQFSGIVASGLTPMILTALFGEFGIVTALLYPTFAAVVTIACLLLIRKKSLYP